MKSLGLAVLLALTCLALRAQSAEPLTEPSEQAERARIERSRALEEARFAQEEPACYARFAVNDCLIAERARRREALADLRRQENVLNDAERRRKGAQQIMRTERMAPPAAVPAAPPATSPRSPA